MERKKLIYFLPCCGKSIMIEYTGTGCQSCDRRIMEYAEKELNLARQEHMKNCLATRKEGE